MEVPTANLVAAIILIAAIGCRDAASTPRQYGVEPQDPPTVKSQAERKLDPETHPKLRFSVEDFRLAFLHESGASGEFTYPEILCGGVCLADLDGDHDLDVYLPQGGAIPGQSSSTEAPHPASSMNSLYLNDGKGVFEDASTNTGVGHHGYGMGAFAADLDADHDLDLLLTNAGQLTVLINQGDATFIDQTVACGIPSRNGLWMNAVFADFDHDGVLDVYVANYTDWRNDGAPKCTSAGGRPDYCDPSDFPGASDLLLFGKGDGTFRDGTASSGVGQAASRSMGVVALDVEGDDDLDIYVACDAEENLLWINQGDGTFKEEAMIRGAALNSAGAAEASMGIACADIDADGDEDLILTHLAQESHTVYRNEGGFFVDATAASGVGRWSRPDTGFGVGLVDFDNDGILDLMVANGAVARPTRPMNPDNPYAQFDRVVQGLGGGKFGQVLHVAAKSPVGDAGGGCTGHVSRGAAFGDLDGDGLVDVVVVNKDAPLRVLLNSTEGTGNWIGIRPVPQDNAPAVINTRVELKGAAGVAHQTIRPHGSYLSSSEPVARFGLGDQSSPVSVITTWPDGAQEMFSQLSVNKVHDVVRGRGMPRPDARQSVSRGTRLKRRRRGQAHYDDTQIRFISYPSKFGPIPPLRINSVDGQRTKQAELDQKALDEWCRNAGLPAPPDVTALDVPSWILVHKAIEDAGHAPSVETLSDLAMHYDGHGVTESAITLYKRVVEHAPEESKWWHLLGRCMLKQGDAAAAIPALECAHELLPTQTATKALLADAKLATGEASEAIALWKSYLERATDSPFGQFGLARAFEANDQPDEALSTARKALARNPKARNALVLAARVAGRMGDTKTAKAYADQTVALTKADDVVLFDEFEIAMFSHAKPVGYLQLATDHYRGKGEFDKAYDTAKLLAERRPDEAQNWQLVLWLATANRDVEALVGYAKTAVELDDAFAPGLDVLARQDLQDGEHAAAAQKAFKALKLQPNFTNAHLTFGLALGKLERHKDAIKQLDKFLSAAPTNLLALQMKTVCLVKLKQSEEAAVVAQRMLKIDPDNAWAKQILETINQ